MKTFTYNTDIYNRPEYEVTVEAPEYMKFVLIVTAENGEVVKKFYSFLTAASSALRYYLDKYDKKNLGASGTWYKMTEVA